MTPERLLPPLNFRRRSAAKQFQNDIDQIFGSIVLKHFKLVSMTSSTKKKRERKKDFQKPKLKVGKAKPKPLKWTVTSFRANGKFSL